MKDHQSEPLIPRDLCTRCGACFAVDFDNVLTKDNEGYPLINNKIPNGTERLRNICAGANWNYREILDFVYGKDYKYNPMSPDKGNILRLGIAYSTDSECVLNGQSGGVSTTLFRVAFETGLIAQALLIKRPNTPEELNKLNATDSIPFIAKNIKDLTNAAGSKYTICSPLEKLPNLENNFLPYGMSLLPCQTMGFQKLRSKGYFNDKDLCKIIIGPFCGLNLNKIMGKEIAEILGLNPSSIELFKNRGGKFPGETIFKTNKNVIKLDRKLHRAFYRMYSPTRCWTCTDFGNELADISIADCWITNNNNNDYKFPNGAAWVLIRTQRGNELLEKSITLKKLNFIEMPIDSNDKKWEQSFLHRKVRSHNRINILRKLGIKVPQLDYIYKIKNASYYKADSRDIFFLRIFKKKIIRKNFLRFWIFINKRNDTLSKEIVKIFSKSIFTHHSTRLNKLKIIQTIFILTIKLCIKKVRLFFI